MHKKCSQCGCPLEEPLDQSLGVCKKAQCRNEQAIERKRRREAEQKAARVRILRQVLDDTLHLLADTPSAAERILDPSQTVAVVVPSCEPDVRPLPPERRAKFIEHLDELLSQVPELLSKQDEIRSILTEFEHRTSENDSQVPLPVINGCTTCRGYCCQAGGTTAFITARLLAWQMLKDGGMTLQSLREKFIEHLPDHSVDDSCVFHSGTGCKLPRELRANICNGFHCEKLLDAEDSFYSTPESGPKVFIAFAVDGEQPRRLGVMQPNAQRQEFKLSAAPQ